jgi:hypothetical protein
MVHEMLTPMNQKAPTRTFFVGGNFKSNLNKASLKELVLAISKHQTAAGTFAIHPLCYNAHSLTAYRCRDRSPRPLLARGPVHR